ncbi:MAG: hypothetical protein WBA16_02290 [Nonlabens sp.]
MNKTVFIIISVIFLLWNLMGLGAFIAEMAFPELMEEQMNATQLDTYRARPWWYVIFYAMATVAGFLGAILLLARKKLAVTMIFISLLGVIGTTGYNLYNGSWELIESGDKIMFLSVSILSVLYLVFARYAAQKGLLK